jgi:hypothetical protein
VDGRLDRQMVNEADGGMVVADFDFHGLIGIRLVDASERDVATVRRQLGPIDGRIDGAPEILIRFVDQLPPRPRDRYLGLNEAGFDHDSFFILQDMGRDYGKVLIGFDQIGDHCEIVCTSGVSAVPLLIPILNLTLLTKGVLPLHASAFTYSGTGVLVTGWAKGGKTETLLAFMANGAEYIGDEWVYALGDGRTLYGIPEPIRIWEWHLDDLPQYKAAIGRRGRRRLRAVKVAHSLGQRIPRRGPGRGLGRYLSLLQKQMNVRVPPETLFGVGSCVLEGKLDKVFFVVSHEASEVVIEPIDSDEVAQRIFFSLQHEELKMLSNYLRFRFAFPKSKSLSVEEANSLRSELLGRILGNKEAYVAYHPFPARIPELFDAIRPYVE